MASTTVYGTCKPSREHPNAFWARWMKTELSGGALTGLLERLADNPDWWCPVHGTVSLDVEET